ncbi:MAG: hypothetical protein ACM3X4_01890 [Ignavibacteriales bacterium]
MAARDAPARARFRAAHNYVVYYGDGRLDDLAQFDVAILESSAYAAGEVEDLSQRGCLPISYLSVLESSDHLPYHQFAACRDFLTLSGSRVLIPEFDTWVMDIREPHWREVLLTAAGDMLERKRFSGLFLDTVSRVEDPSFPASLSLDLAAGVLEFVSTLRRNYPGAVLIQNLGLERLVRHTAPLLDGVCWEGFGSLPCHDSREWRWMLNKIRELKQLREQYGIRIMLLGHAALGREVEAILSRSGPDELMSCWGLSYSRAVQQEMNDRG